MAYEAPPLHEECARVRGTDGYLVERCTFAWTDYLPCILDTAIQSDQAGTVVCTLPLDRRPGWRH